MKSTKKILALLLAVMMIIGIFAACGNADSNDSGTPSSESTPADDSQPESKPESQPDSQDQTPGDDTIHPMRIVQPGALSLEHDIGMAAVNEKLQADGVNIEVSVQRIPWSSYAEKLNMMLTTGEPFENLLVMQDVKNLSSIAAMNALLPIDEYLDKYPNLVSSFTELEWMGGIYNGQKYAIPCTFISLDKILSYLNYRSDIARKVGYEEFPETVDGIIDLMEKSQAAILEENGKKAYSWMHQIQDTAHWLHRSYDTFPFYVENSLGLIISRQDGTIDSFYESEEFKKDCEVYYEMYQKGLVDPDVLSLESSKKYDDASLGAFLPSQTFDPDQVVSIRTDGGIPDADVDWVRTFPDQPDVLYTYSQVLNCVSSTAEDPESVLKFYDWLYTNDENYALFHFGIEGTHYTLNEEGRIERKTDEGGSTLYNMDEWMTGSIALTKFNINNTDKNIEFLTYKSKDYVVSPVAGFLFDASNVQTELTNLQTEIIASIYPIKMGMVPYEENIGPAIEKLKAAGLDSYMEEYRKQFAEYLEANPDVLEIAKGTRG